MAKKKTIKFDPTKDRVITFNRDGEKLSEINGELKSDFYSGIEKMCYLTDQLCAFYKGKKMGVVNSKGIMITPAEWESVKYEGEVFQISKKNKVTKDVSYGYINFDGEELFDPFEYTSVNDVFDGRIVATSLDAKKECAFDLKGNMVIAPKYVRLGNFYNNVATAAEEKGKVGLIDLMGNWVLQPEYSSIGGFGSSYDGIQKYSAIGKDGKYGLINQELKIVLEPKYDGIRNYDDEDGLIVVVEEGDKEGLVDEKGNWLIPAEYDRVSMHKEEGYIELEKRALRSVADMKGNFIMKDVSARDLSLQHGLIVISTFDDVEVKKLDGTTIYKGEAVKVFKDIILVSADRKLWGVINHEGVEILPQEWKIPAQFVNQVEFSEGLLNLFTDDKTVYIDEKGEVKISVGTRGWAFSNGYALIGKRDDYSIINLSGEVVASHLAHPVNLGNGFFYVNNEEENEPKILNLATGATAAIPARVVGKPINGYIKMQAPDLNYGVVSIANGKVILEPIYNQVLLTADGIWGYVPKVK